MSPQPLLGMAAGLLLAAMPPSTAQPTTPPPMARVTVVNAGPTGLAVGSRDPSLEMRLGLQALDATATDLAVSITDLRAESGSVTPVSVGAPPVELGVGKVASVTVTASLSEPGAYTGTIVVSHDGRSEPAVALIVTRSRTEPTVEIGGTGNVERTRYWPGDHRTRVELTLRETAGQDVRLSRPTLVDLGRADGDIAMQPDNPTVDVQARAPGGEWRDVDNTGLTVPQGQSVDLRLSLPGFSAPGTYSATVKLAEPGGLAITKNVKAFVRLAVWSVWVAVAVGILIGFLLRTTLRRSREKAVLQRRLREIELTVGEAVGDRADEKTTALVEAMFVAAGNLDRRVEERSADLPSLTAEIDRLDGRVGVAGLWIRQHVVAAAVRPPSVVADETEKLYRQYAELVEPSTTSARIAELRAEVLAIAAALPKKIEAALRARAQELTALLDAHEPYLTPAVGPRVPGVRERLEGAGTAISGGDYGGASTALVGVEEQIVGLLIDDLRESVKNLPAWVSDWKGGIMATVLAALDTPGSPRARYDDALRKLVQELVTYALARAGSLKDVALKGEVVTLLQQAEKTLASTSPSDTLAARALLERALTLAGGFVQDLSRGPQEGGLDRTVPTGADLGTRISAVSVVPLPDRLMHARAELAAIARRLRMIDRVSLAVAAVVALLIGTLVLYDRDWGTTRDLGAAVAWGLGIQVGSGFAFTGVDSLLAQLQGTQPAAAPHA